MRTLITGVFAATFVLTGGYVKAQGRGGGTLLGTPGGAMMGNASAVSGTPVSNWGLYSSAQGMMVGTNNNIPVNTGAGTPNYVAQAAATPQTAASAATPQAATAATRQTPPVAASPQSGVPRRVGMQTYAIGANNGSLNTASVGRANRSLFGNSRWQYPGRVPPAVLGNGPVGPAGYGGPLFSGSPMFRSRTMFTGGYSRGAYANGIYGSGTYGGGVFGTTAAGYPVSAGVGFGTFGRGAGF
jgi:hypothetical protein